MRSRITTTIAAYAILSLAGAFSFCLPKSLPTAGAATAAPPHTVSVTGKVRDFRRGDTEFVPPGYSSTIGHVAGNIGDRLGADGRPFYMGTGFEVDDQWRNEAWQPIAPHLYRNAVEMRQVKVVAAPSVSAGPTVDTFDSTLGPYGGTNVGPKPTFVAGSVMPVIAPPLGMPPLTNQFQRDGNATTVVDYDINCNIFNVKNYHRVQFKGIRRIVCNVELMIENHAKIELLPGAKLTIWVMGIGNIKNHIEMNTTTQDPSRMVINHLGVTQFLIENSASTYVTLLAPNGGLFLKNSAEFCGKYIGRSVQLDNDCGFHLDTGGPTQMCGVDFADSAGVSGGASGGGITSLGAFGRWYADSLDYNLSASHDIILSRNASGVYEYLDDAFFPIDNRLFGNEGQAHNYYFTFTFSVEFVHRACDKRYLQFEGADDVWAFVDDKLALDIGGILPGTEQYIEFDRMNLKDGETYRLHFFYAQRNPSTAMFRLRTNADLVKPAYGASASPIFD